MPLRIIRRPATLDERQAIEKVLACAPTLADRLKRGVVNTLVLWAASLLAVVVVWLALGWIAGKILGVNLGLHSAATLWVVRIALPACAIVAAIFSIKWVRGWADYRPALREDLAQSQVDEEQYTFTEGKRFQEQEHGGLVYFLRSAENEVFVVFDSESANLGAGGEDPLRSSYRPQSNLVIVRAPKSGWVLDRKPSGAELRVGPPVDLMADDKEWPEDETLCNIPWSQLDARLGYPADASDAQHDDPASSSPSPPAFQEPTLPAAKPEKPALNTAWKLGLSFALLVFSVLLLRVSGWFGIGIPIGLPLFMLYWFDLGRELRAKPPSNRVLRIVGWLMGIPLLLGFLFLLLCLAAMLFVGLVALYR